MTDTAHKPRPTFNIAALIVNSGRPAHLRWRATPDAILRGEAREIIKAHNVYPTEERVTALTALMSLLAKTPEAFTMEAGPYLQTGVGKALHERVRGLSNAEGVAARTLKIWNSSSVEDFTRIHLPSLVRYATASRKHLTFSAPNLLEALFIWNEQKPRVMQSISEEYFAENLTPERNQK